MEQRTNHCFGCGPENPVGLHLSFDISVSDEGVLMATAEVLLDDRYQGATGFLHGGILATLMDEAMSKLNRPLGLKAVTRHLAIDYLQPSPVGRPMRLIGRHLRREGRKLFHTAELLDEHDAQLVKSTGLFVVIANKET